MSDRTSLEVEVVFGDLERHGALPADPATRDWLELLLVSLRDEARLSPWGGFVVRQQIVRSAVALDSLGGIDDGEPADPVAPAVVIGGLPRTGTTLLHALLAECEALWAPTTVEFDHPRTIGAPGGVSEEQRSDCDARLAAFARYAPGFDAIHPLGSSLAEECDALLEHTFESFRYLVHHDCPSYRTAWLESAHERPYRLLAAVLARRGSDLAPSVLKAPGHLHGYPTMLRHLTPRTVVQIHRPVETVLASWLSLVAAVRGVTSREVADHQRLADEWLDVFETMVGSAERSALASATDLIGVDFARLCAEPIEVVRGLAEAAAFEVTDADLQRMGTIIDRLAEGPGHDYDPTLSATSARRAADLDARYGALVRGATFP